MNPRALRLHVERLHSSKRGKREKEIEKKQEKTRVRVERKRNREKTGKNSSSRGETLLGQERRKEKERNRDSTQVREANKKKESKKVRKEGSVTKTSSHCIPLYPHATHTLLTYIPPAPFFMFEYHNSGKSLARRLFCVFPQCVTLPICLILISLGCLYTLRLC